MLNTEGIHTLTVSIDGVTEDETVTVEVEAADTTPDAGNSGITNLELGAQGSKEVIITITVKDEHEQGLNRILIE